MLAGTDGLLVHAVLSGRVVFAGAVAGHRWVVVQRSDGLTMVVGRLAAVRVHRGAAVAADTVVGVADISIYVGFRWGDTPVDPVEVMAGGWNGTSVRPRLVPGDGTPAAAGAVGACRR